MSTTSSNITCPACHQKRIQSRFSWRAILYAIFCFPCGFYCCMKRKIQYCTQCHCDVVVRAETRALIPSNHSHGYNYRLYESTRTALPPNFLSNRNPTTPTTTITHRALSTEPIGN